LRGPNKLNKKKITIGLSAFICLLIYMTSLPATASIVGAYHPDSMERKQLRGPVDLVGEILIFYDPNHPLFEAAAESIFDSTRIVYLNTHLVPITTAEELFQALNELSDAFAVIWMFDTDLKGIKVGEDTIPWEIIAEYFSYTVKPVEHIMGLGNTDTLWNIIRTKGVKIENLKLYTQPTASGIVDLKYGYLFSMWKIAELLQAKNESKYRLAGEALQRFSLRYFEMEINDLMERNVEPKTPIGEENLTDRQVRMEELENQFPKGIKNRAKFNPAIPGALPPVYFKSNLIQDSPTDLLLSVLPLNSGLRGTIGFILDLIFELALDSGDSDIMLSGDAIELIFNSFKVITSLVGGGDVTTAASSALKSLLELLNKEFPFGDQLLPYMNLVIDGLFALKGDFNTISNFIKTLLELLIPDSLTGAETIRGIISSVLGVTSSVIDAVNDGEELLTALMKALSTNLMDFFIGKFLNETLGVSLSQVNEFKDKIMGVAKIIFDLINGDLDIKQLLLDNLGTILTTLFDLIPSSAQETINQMISWISFGFSVVQDLNSPTKLIDRAVELLEKFLPESIANNANKLKEIAEKLMEKIGQIREQGVTQFTNIKSTVESVFNDAALLGLTLDSNLKDFLVNVTVWVFGVLADKVPDTERLKFPSLRDLLTQFMIWAGESIIGSDVRESIQRIMKMIFGVVAFVKDTDKQIKQLVSKTEGFFQEIKKDPIGVITSVLGMIFNATNSTIMLNYLDQVKSYAELALGVYKLIANAKANSFQGVLQLIVSLLGTGLFKSLNIPGLDDIGVILKVIQAIIPDVLGVANAPSPMEAVREIINLVSSFGLDIGGVPLTDILDVVLNIVVGARELFTNGIQWIFGQVIEWLGRKVEELINSLLDSLMSSISGSTSITHYNGQGKPVLHNGTVLDEGVVTNNGTYLKPTQGDMGMILLDLDIPANFGGFSLFSLTIQVGLKLNFAFDSAAFKDMLVDVIFKGKSLFEGGFGAFIGRLFGFMEISPLLTARLELGGFGSGKNSFMNYLLTTLGLKLDFSGSGFFAMNLLTFKGGQFKLENFLKIVEWGFKFTITLSKDFTLLDFLTGGVGGGVLNAVAEFLGLGGIIVTVSIGLTIEVIKRAASAAKAEESSFTLTITIGVKISIGISLFIVGIELWGSMEIILTFFQDLATPSPLQIFLDIIFKFGVVLTFLFVDWDATFEWHAVHLDLSPSSKADQQENGGKGFDTDQDGLSDEYETSVPGLKIDSEDSDEDGLTDKYETQISNTDPSKVDTDNDGLSDQYEIETVNTNPLVVDSDYDKLTDFQEVSIYSTNPLQRDTDGDGLDDNFEVNHAWNITSITPSVKSVSIGGVSYNDHTDPLIPDTDGDGLLDGQEGERGPWYGNPMLRNPAIDDEYDIRFNGGFTHPLDNDTDDDSYVQIVNGTIAPSGMFLRDMSDKVEIDGQYVIFYIEGEPTLNLSRTNPVRPDSDGDTGWTGDLTNAPINRFLNGDGYELSLNPPTDPMDGDTDDDALMDGLEGTLAYDSNRTNPNNPDTDGDGLGDMQEILLGSNPLHVDSDNDMVPDGMEYIVFGTSVFLNDTDLDGLTDGQELFWFHTSPFISDSDGDTLSDAAELFDYYSDPMDEDSDNDGLSDFEEIKLYLTLVNDPDTDDDGLWDGEEINQYKTSPFLWDTDNDSIYYPDPTTESGIAQRFGDYEEVMYNQSNPTVSDTDLDGISDGWEVYLASGHVPFMDAIPLNLSSNDTDGDGLFDGQEMIVANSTNLIYPFVSFHLVFPFKTSPVLADTDADGLTDSEEIRIYLTDPTYNDTDNDTLTDYEEVQFHGTNPLKKDTDSDGLLDIEELTSAVLEDGPGLPSSSLYNTTIKVYSINGTLANNSDTDGDMLPDGAELQIYNSNPLLWDENENELPDGLDYDSDYDGLVDGLEYLGNYTGSFPYDREGADKNETVEVYQNWTVDSSRDSPANPTRPFVPDSDFDGLPDGLEVFNIGTNPVYNDTDNDSLSDGLEVRIGTDPLNDTSWSDFVTAMENYTLVMIASPVPASYTGRNIQLKVNAPSEAIRVTYRIFDGETYEWSPEKLLIWNQVDQAWTLSNTFQLFDPGNYYFRSYAYLSTGEILVDGVSFAVQKPLVHFVFEGLDTNEGLKSSSSINIPSLLLIGIIGGSMITIVALNRDTIQAMISSQLKRESNKED
jgi:hypothetical protein